MIGAHNSRLRLGLVVALAVVILSACGGAAARFTGHLQRGKDFLAAGNIDKAGVEFRNAAQIQPKSSEALYYNGRVAEAKGNIRAALGLYQAAVDTDPKNNAAAARLGKMLVFAGAAQRAVDVVGPRIREHPDDPDLLAVLAAAHHQLKQDDTARAEAQKAVQVAPANEDAVAVLAALYAAAGAYDRAIPLVTAAVTKAPNSAGLREILTNLYLANAQPGEAQEQMRALIALKPLELALRSQLAAYLVRIHDLDGAQKVLEEAVRAYAQSKPKTDSGPAKLMLVDFIVQERSRQQGETVLRSFIREDPDDLDLRLALASLLQKAGAVADAKNAYRQIVDRDGTGPKGLVARDRMAKLEADEGHIDAARQLLAEVLAKNPRDDEALLVRSGIEMQRNDSAGAIGDLRAVLRDRPQAVDLQQALAQAYLASGDRALAEETLRALMQQRPDDVAVRIGYAQFLAQTDRAEASTTLLEETVKRSPNNLLAREALIRNYMAKPDLTAARAAAEEVSRLQPKSAVGFVYSGVIAGREHRLDESEKDLRHALDLEPRSVPALTAFVELEASRGQYDAGIEKTQASLASAPDDPRMLDMLGGLYFSKQDYAHARETFEHERAANPGLWQPHHGLALLKQAQGDVSGAMSEYAAALSLAPAEPRLLLELATLEEQHGKPDEAISHYETMYRNDPKSLMAANNLAMLLVTYRKDRISLDRAQELTTGFESSSNASLIDTEGWVRFKRGEFKDAVAALQRANALQPDSKVILYHLGMAQIQLGERDRARSNLEAALAGSPAFSGADEARVALATLKASSG